MKMLSRDGTIVMKNQIVCNRIGLTPEIVFSSGDEITIDTKNPYTVSKMTKGILLSFYSIENAEFTGLEWFQMNSRSWFLSSQTKIDAHKSFWKGFPPFGEMLSKDYLTALDTRYCWSFFLYYPMKNVLGISATPKYILTTLWDIQDQVFIPPNKWPKYLDSRWAKKGLCTEPIESLFKFDKKEINYLTAITRRPISDDQKFSYPDWVEQSVSSFPQYEALSPNIIKVLTSEKSYFQPSNEQSELSGLETFSTNAVRRKSIHVKSGEPLLVTIYEKDKLHTIKIVAKEDINMQIIAKRSLDKFESLLIAILRKEDTKCFENKYFTGAELYNFYDRLKRGKKAFFNQIFEKDIMHKYITFPDKIYNTIRMGQILLSKMSCMEKQEQIWNELSRCRGWKTCAISSFYSTYVKTAV